MTNTIWKMSLGFSVTQFCYLLNVETSYYFACLYHSDRVGYAVLTNDLQISVAFKNLFKIFAHLSNVFFKDWQERVGLFLSWSLRDLSWQHMECYLFLCQKKKRGFRNLTLSTKCSSLEMTNVNCILNSLAGHTVPLNPHGCQEMKSIINIWERSILPTVLMAILSLHRILGLCI